MEDNKDLQPELEIAPEIQEPIEPVLPEVIPADPPTPPAPAEIPEEPEDLSIVLPPVEIPAAELPEEEPEPAELPAPAEIMDLPEMPPLEWIPAEEPVAETVPSQPAPEEPAISAEEAAVNYWEAQLFAPIPTESDSEEIPAAELPEDDLAAPEAALPLEPAAVSMAHTGTIPSLGLPLTEQEETPLVPSDPELDAILDEYTGPIPAVPSEAIQTQEPEDMPNSTPAKKKRGKTPPPKKGRPRRRKGEGLFGLPHLAASLLWLAIIVAIGVSLGKLLWVGAADVLAFGRESKTVTISIVDSDDIDTIAAKLEEAGLVKYPELFKFYATLTGSDEEITTGTFELNTNLDYHALTNALSPSSASRTVVTVTIPEGYNCRQIFNLLASNNVCSVEALEEYAASGEVSEYWFLEGLERGDKYCLEGFLFPDTYEFYVNSTPKEVISKLLAGFNVRFSQELRDQIDVLNARLTEVMVANGKDETYIAEHQFTVYEVIIVASLIEKETAGSSESAKIASVIYNRLFNWGENPAYLNFDSTIVYAQNGDASTLNTSLDSPYNTYKYTGLTPTPITNPGLASIEAALNPDSTSYYYFVLNPEIGLHEFSVTYEEHQKRLEDLGY